MREDSEGRLAEEVQGREKRGHVHQMGILTVDAVSYTHLLSKIGLPKSRLVICFWRRYERL